MKNKDIEKWEKRRDVTKKDVEKVEKKIEKWRKINSKKPNFISRLGCNTIGWILLLVFWGLSQLYFSRMEKRIRDKRATYYTQKDEDKINLTNLNAPNGFTKTGNLEWNNGNENVVIQSFKGNTINKKMAISTCEKGNRGADYVGFDTIEINAKEYDICIQKGKNGLIIGWTQVYKNGYTYMIMVTSNPDDYDRMNYLISYMLQRI